MDNTNAIMELDSIRLYTSVQGNTFEEKKRLYNAMNSPDEILKDHINEVIEIADIFMERVTVTDSETGEVRELPRIVLISSDGVSYQALSKGVYESVKRLITVFGHPTWEPAIPVKVQQVSRNNRNMLTFSLA